MKSVSFVAAMLVCSLLCVCEGKVHNRPYGDKTEYGWLAECSSLTRLTVDVNFDLVPAKELTVISSLRGLQSLTVRHLSGVTDVDTRLRGQIKHHKWRAEQLSKVTYPLQRGIPLLSHMPKTEQVKHSEVAKLKMGIAEMEKKLELSQQISRWSGTTVRNVLLHPTLSFVMSLDSTFLLLLMFVLMCC